MSNHEATSCNDKEKVMHWAKQESIKTIKTIELEGVKIDLKSIPFQQHCTIIAIAKRKKCSEEEFLMMRLQAMTFFHQTSKLFFSKGEKGLEEIGAFPIGIIVALSEVMNTFDLENSKMLSQRNELIEKKNMS